MSHSLGQGMAAALGAAVLYGCAPTLQAAQARVELPGRGLGAMLVLRLATRPLWLLGLVFDIGAFLLEAYAFSSAPATLVAPLTACELVFFVPAARLLLGEKPGRLSLVGLLAMAGGVALLGTSFGGSVVVGHPASEAQLLWFLVATGVVAGVAAVVGSRAMATGRTVFAAVLFSAAAGFAYGLSTLATRQIGRSFSSDHPWDLLQTATPYALVGCSLLGIGLMQRGLQANPWLTFPITSAVGAMLPVLLSATLLGDQVPGGTARVSFVAALVLVLCGAIVLGRDRARAERLA